MSDFTLRPATPTDQWTIRWMVAREMLDPTALHWSHFIVAESDGTVIGIGQVRPHPGCPELGSLVVRPSWRGRGVGAALMHALVASVDGVVYLECASKMVPYYQRFGFTELTPAEAPPPLSTKAGFANRYFGWTGVRVAVMARTPP